MKNQYSRMDNICPKEPKKLRIPDQLDLYMEDGTIYHVRSFFAGELVMGDVLDALTMENWKGRSESRHFAQWNQQRRSGIIQSGFLIVIRTAFREVKEENAGTIQCWNLRQTEPGR